MKILFIGTTDNLGGAAIVGWEIGNSLMEKGHEVNYLVDIKTVSNKRIHLLRTQLPLDSTIRKFTGRSIRQWLSYLRIYPAVDNMNTGSIKKIIQNPLVKEADIIHCHNLHGGYFNLNSLIQISQEKPVIWTLHDMWAFTGGCFHSFSCERWRKKCGHCPNLKTFQSTDIDNTSSILSKKKMIYKKTKLNIVAPSNWLYKKLDRSIMKSQHKHVIYNGIDTDVFKPGKQNSFRKKLKLPLNKKIILFVAYGGKNNPFKGGKYLDHLVKEYKSRSDIIFLCIGQEENPAPSEKNIIYLPYISDKKVLSSYFSASDVFLFTSLAENCPLVVIEALSSGIPILSFDVGGVREIVEHKKNGYIVKYKNKKDLKRGFEWILNLSSEKIKKIKKQNREKAIKDFLIKTMVDQYLKLYKQLLK